MTELLTNEVRKLSTAEKIQLAEAIWDEVAEAGDSLPVPPSHRRELDSRLKAHLKSPGSALKLEEFRRRLAKRL